MKSVEAEDRNEEQEEVGAFELKMRKLARQIFEETFPNQTATPQRIEAVVREIVITDEDGFVREAIEEEKQSLLHARGWAKEAYGDDSPEATMLAYEILFGQTADERHWEISEKLDELTSKRGKK